MTREKTSGKTSEATRRGPDSGPGDAPSFAAAASTLDRATYENLRRALELGRWPDGRRLEPRQREICMQAVLTWEARHLPAEERTGWLEADACRSGPASDPAAPRPVRVLDPDGS